MTTAAYLPRFDRKAGLNFVLTERDIEILRVINRYRYLRTGQIKRLLFQDNTSIQSTRRRLRFLYHNGYVGRMVPYVKAGSGGEEVAYHLDKAGEQTLRELGVDIRSPVKVGQVRPNFLHHALELSEFRVCLELALQEQNRIDLHRFVCDFELKSHLQKNSGKRRYRLFDEIEHPTTKKRFVVYPDGLIILRAKGAKAEHHALYFLEIDRGTEGLRVIQDKFIGYRLYQEQGRFKKYGSFSHFRLLFQTTSSRRANNMAAALHDYEASDIVFITTRDQVSEQTVLSSTIWKTTAGEPRSLLK